jgi:uncharacterized membrane protein YdbT with pleckstrin-like domain
MSNQTISPEYANEQIVWSGSQSQVLNFGNFLLCIIIIIALSVVSTFVPPAVRMVVLALSALPILYGFYKFLVVWSVRYKITNQRIVCTTGIFSKKVDAVELYRVRDIELKQPFTLRIFGKGVIELLTIDTTSPNLYLKAIPHPVDLFDKIRIAVEQRRDQKRVRGMEFDHPDAIIDNMEGN